MGVHDLWLFLQISKAQNVNSKVEFEDTTTPELQTGRAITSRVFVWHQVHARYFHQIAHGDKRLQGGAPVVSLTLTSWEGVRHLK